MYFLITMQRSKLIHMIFLPIQETLTFDDVIIHIKSVLNKGQNHYYYNTFLEKCYYELDEI